MSDQGLAYYGNRVARPPRRGPLARSISWVLVALVHVLLITLFVMSEILPDNDIRHPLPIETMFLLSMLPNTTAPQIKIIRPEVPNATAPIITTAPLVVVPQEEPPMIQPETAEDILKSIGEALACGANSFEYLTQGQRNHCPHQPWLGRKLPNGVIVLDSPPKEDVPAIHMSGAEQLRHDMQTGPACPILQQAPCLHDVVTGANMKAP